MIARRFNQIFWGLILVILDLNINNFDVLPDFVGYILVAVGAGGLKAISLKFAVASTLSWVLMCLSLLGFFVSGDHTMAMTVIDLAVDCVMIWNLLGGVIAFSEKHNRMDLALRASKRRLAYVVLMVLVTIIGYAAADTGSAAVAVMLVFTLLVVLIMIIHLLRRVRNEIAMGLV